MEINTNDVTIDTQRQLVGKLPADKQLVAIYVPTGSTDSMVPVFRSQTQLTYCFIRTKDEVMITRFDGLVKKLLKKVLLFLVYN